MNDKYMLKLLAKDYPNRKSALGEIIRLEIMAALPKGTEYFFSDIHGEDKAFIHLMRSGSGNIRRKIREVFMLSLTEEEQDELAFFVYDPNKALEKNKEKINDEKWFKLMLLRLIELARYISSKYARSEVRKKIESRYVEIVEELFDTNDGELNRSNYIDVIIEKIFENNSQIDFISSLCRSIQLISINHLHIIGDIFDRGPGPHKIIEELIDFAKVGDVDIQWGNHDVVWMGAELGNEVCMLSVLRIGLRYNSFDAIEDGYGIHLRALSEFADEYYKDDPCEYFKPKSYDENIYDIVDEDKTARMHKAVTIMELKLEGELYKRHPEYKMNDRIVLEMIDYEKGTIEMNGKTYKLRDTNFPTIDPENPLKLNEREKEIMNGIIASFTHSETLNRHVQFLYSHGSSYLSYNGNLLFHGGLPMTYDGKFDGITINNKKLVGKELMDYIDYSITQAFYEENPERKKYYVDFFWYLWCGANSPMFGKSKMATFEGYFIEDKNLSKEYYNPYYELSKKEDTCNKILSEFGLDPSTSHIINGHVPVKLEKGETPIRANGKLFVIDGGLAKAYQEVTGIAGYTLMYNSHNISLAAHKDFKTIEDEIETYSPTLQVVKRMDKRVLISETDLGREYKEKIRNLNKLIDAYKNGDLKENFSTSYIV